MISKLRRARFICWRKNRKYSESALRNFVADFLVACPSGTGGDGVPDPGPHSCLSLSFNVKIL